MAEAQGVAGAPGGASSLADRTAAVIEANQQARAELMAAIDALSSERRRDPWFGQWSLHEILAHLFTWQDGFAHALERMARGERPEVPGYEPNLEDADDRFNAVAVEENGHLEWEQLLAHLRAARERHEAAVRGLVGRLAPERFMPGSTAWRLADSAAHDREHLDPILEWRREQRISQLRGPVWLEDHVPEESA